MKATGIIRRIDELGRIVVPKEMRTKMDINDSDPVEIYVEGDKIILQKYTPYCIFCASSENISVYKGKKLCATCIEEIKSEL